MGTRLVQMTFQTHVQNFPIDQANEILIALKKDAIRGAGVLLMP
jgi:hypothetical protein